MGAFEFGAHLIIQPIEYHTMVSLKTLQLSLSSPFSLHVFDLPYFIFFLEFIMSTSSDRFNKQGLSAIIITTGIFGKGVLDSGVG